MANTLTNILPKILTRALPVLRQNARTPGLVNRNFNITAGQRGKTIDVPIGAAMTATAVTPAANPPSTNDLTPTTAQIVLDQWWHAHFTLTDQEVTQIDSDGLFIPLQASEAVKAVSNKVDQVLLACYKKVYNFAGTAGTTPFASAHTVWSGATGVSKLMDDGLAPPDQRYVMLNTAANANARGLSPFADASQRGSDETIRSGNIGYVLGADWYMNQNIPTHTRGTSASGTATTTAGSKNVTIASGGASGTFLAGDLITIATLAGQYVVDADVTLNGSGAGTIVVSPAAAASVTTQAITYVATHAANLAWHRDAFALATALPSDIAIPGLGNGEASSVIVDPVTGLALRLQVVRAWMQTYFVFDVLFGVNCTRPELAGRILG